MRHAHSAPTSPEDSNPHRGRLLAALAVCAAALVLLLCAAPAGAMRSSARTPAVSLRLTYDTREYRLAYSLTCEPTGGTLPRAASACAAVSRNPAMVLGEPPPPPGPLPLMSCPAPSANLTVEGTFHANGVSTMSGNTCGGGVFFAWMPFLPSEEQLHRLRPNRGLGPLALGESGQGAAALLGPPTTILAGASLYRLGTVEEGGPTTTEVPLIFVVDYHAGRVSTLISNDRADIAGRWSLTAHPPAGSPLRRWRTVTCGGRPSLASRPLQQDLATSLVWPSAVLPTAIVTDEPARACRLAVATEQAVRPLG
jgi:hypothetical protein